MPQENIELVRLAIERHNCGNLDAFLELCAPDLEFRDVPALPGSGVYVGHEAYRGWYAQMDDAFEELRYEPVEFIDAGDQVLVVNHGVGTGKGSGARVEMDFSNVWTVNDGRIVRIAGYDSHAEALEAAGLRE